MATATARERDILAAFEGQSAAPAPTKKPTKQDAILAAFDAAPAAGPGGQIKPGNIDAALPEPPENWVALSSRPPHSDMPLVSPRQHGGASDYALAAELGILSSISGLMDPELAQPSGVAKMARQAALDYSDASTMSPRGKARKARMAAALVPFIGSPVNRILAPAQAYEAGEAPSHEQNVAAVESGAALAAMLVGPRVVGGLLRGQTLPRGDGGAVTPEVPPDGADYVALVKAAAEGQAKATPRTDLATDLRAKSEEIAANENLPPELQTAVESTRTRDADLAARRTALDSDALREAAEDDAWSKADSAVRYKGQVTTMGDTPHEIIRERLGIKPEYSADGVWLSDWPRDAEHGWVVDGKFVSGADIDATPHKSIVEAIGRAEQGPAVADQPSGVAEDSYLQRVRTLVAERPVTHADASMAIPNAGAVLNAVKKFGPAKEFIDGVAPASASEGAAAAADILRRSKAEIANAATVERVRNREVAKTFEKAGDAKNIANISAYERTGQFADDPPGYSEMYRETTDAAHQTLSDVYGDDHVGYVENYVRRAFQFGSKADEAKATGVLSNWIGSLSASKSPLRGRTFKVPLDEALALMKAEGLKVKQVTTNPEILRQWTVENANQARVYKQAWEDAKAGELIKFVRRGSRTPEGMVALEDRVAHVFRPTGNGPVETGRYYAEPGVARIFNNAISRGFGGSPTFRSIRAINNAYNQMQLGLSAFHLTGTAINASVSDMSLGMQQILQGDFGPGVKSIGRSAVPGYSFGRDMVRGRAFMRDLVANDPHAQAVLEDVLNPAGGRLGVDAAYRNAAYENMVRAWSNRRVFRAAGNVPLAIVQKIASPLMEYAIPRVKIGAFLDLAEAQRKGLGPNATEAQIQRAYQKAWDSVDNRFGQLAHDNLFWDRHVADLAQVSTRSVGWNLGTLRELGGGILDLSRGDIKSPRTLYAASLPIIAGTIGAVYQYLHTGQGPQGTRDYFYPRNGLLDNRGRQDRVALPTYMKDVFAYSSHPIVTLEHKASPILSMAFALGTNKDYFGDMIRNPEDTNAKQWQQIGAYALSQFRPFSVQQAMDTAKEQGGKARAAEQFFGFVKAPAEMRSSPAESEAFKEFRRRKNEAAMEKAQLKHANRFAPREDQPPGRGMEPLPEEAEWMVNGHHENEAMVASTPFSQLLPGHFAKAREAVGSSPVNGGVIGERDTQGVYGVGIPEEKNPFVKGQVEFADGTSRAQPIGDVDRMARWNREHPGSSSELPNVIQTARGVKGDFVPLHEYGHAVWEQDLTDEQRAKFEALFKGRLVAAGGDRSKLPKAMDRPDTEAWHAFPSLFAAYILDPDRLKQKEPSVYRYMKGIFRGREYGQ